MLNTSATNLRNHLFNYLSKVLSGETVAVFRNQQEVARLVPPQKSDWRKRIRQRPKILVKTKELIKPLEEVWEDYL